MSPCVIEKDAVIDGVRIHYAEGGPPSGPCLVLLPGQSMPWQSYQKVLPTLTQRFHVFAIDIRGHGRSEHTPGHYTFSRLGQDCVSFIRDVVGSPAILCGNSSGGIIALWAAAHAPEQVRGVVAEDPPLFTTEWPRSRDDTWVHGFFEHTVRTLPDIATYFSTLTVPTEGRKKLIAFPRPLAWVLGGAIRRRQKAHPGQPVDIAWLPLQVRLFVRGLSEYDVDFTRACADGRMYDVDQSAMLAAVRCPTLLVQAASFRHPVLGLVGAMGDDDVARAQQILPKLLVERLNAPHVVHIAKPRVWLGFVNRIAALADG